MRQKVTAIGQQERAEAAEHRVGRRHRPALEQVGEIPLRQIAGLLGIVPLATNERIDRIPVRSAQFLKRSLRLRRSRVDRVSDLAPAGRGKSSRRNGFIHHRNREADEQEKRPAISPAQGYPTLTACVPGVQFVVLAI